jgi:copper chaperone
MLNFRVEGMSCGHCRSAVTAAIRRIAPEAGIEVDLESGRVTIAGVADRGAIVSAIRGAGYETE